MKPIPNNFKQVVLALFVSASAVTSAYALVAGPPPAASGSDAGCPNTSTKTGVYAPCVGYVAPSATSAIGVHHLSAIPGLVVSSMNTQQAAAKGLLPKALGTPSFGVMVAVSQAGGAGQQNPDSQPPAAPPQPSCAYGYQYINYNAPTWTGWDVLGWNPGSWSYACNPPPPPPANNFPGGGSPMGNNIFCNTQGCITQSGNVLNTLGQVIGSATVDQNGNIVATIPQGAFGLSSIVLTLNTNGGAVQNGSYISTSNAVTNVNVSASTGYGQPTPAARAAANALQSQINGAASLTQLSQNSNSGGPFAVPTYSGIAFGASGATYNYSTNQMIGASGNVIANGQLTSLANGSMGLALQGAAPNNLGATAVLQTGIGQTTSIVGNTTPGSNAVVGVGGNAINDVISASQIPATTTAVGQTAVGQ